MKRWRFALRWISFFNVWINVRLGWKSRELPFRNQRKGVVRWRRRRRWSSGEWTSEKSVRELSWFDDSHRSLCAKRQKSTSQNKRKRSSTVFQHFLSASFVSSNSHFFAFCWRLTDGKMWKEKKNLQKMLNLQLSFFFFFRRHQREKCCLPHQESLARQNRR